MKSLTKKYIREKYNNAIKMKNTRAIKHYKVLGTFHLKMKEEEFLMPEVKAK